jgi:hypothetical protein
LASKPAATDGFWRFGLKTSGDGFLYLTLKLVVTVSLGLVLKSAVGFLVEPQNKLVYGFSVWASKSVAPVCWFGPQNYRDGFLFWVLKPSRLRFIGCAIKPTEGDLAASLDMVSQSGLKTGEGATTGGARNTNTEVALEVS